MSLSRVALICRGGLIRIKRSAMRPAKRLGVHLNLLDPGRGPEHRARGDVAGVGTGQA